MTSRPWRRVIATASAVVLVALLTGIVRLLESHGVFDTVTQGFAGACRAVAGAAGPGDIAIDPQDKIAFIAATDRRTKAAPQDGLYAYAYDRPGAGLVKLAGTPADFHPYGISLYRAADGSLTLMAINRRADKSNTVDIFQVTMENAVARLTEVGSIGGGVLTSPASLVAVDQDRFYLVNDRASQTALGRWLDDALVLPRAGILYFDGVKFVPVADGLNSPSGAALSTDGRYLYVAQYYPRTLLTFERNVFSGQIHLANTLGIAANLDKANAAGDGSIWLGSQPKPFAVAKYRHDAAKPAPSKIFRVAVKDGIPQSADLVYANLGAGIGASSVGAEADGHLLIGSPYDKKILDCELR